MHELRDQRLPAQRCIQLAGVALECEHSGTLWPMGQGGANVRVLMARSFVTTVKVHSVALVPACRRGSRQIGWNAASHRSPQLRLTSQAGPRARLPLAM